MCVMELLWVALCNVAHKTLTSFRTEAQERSMQPGEEAGGQASNFSLFSPLFPLTFPRSSVDRQPHRHEATAN